MLKRRWGFDWVCFLTSATATLLSFSAEWYGITLCNLCLAQRALFAALALFSSLALTTKSSPLQLAMTGCLICLTIVSAYHSLIAFEIIEGRCLALGFVESQDAFLQALQKKQSCKKTSWIIAGIPAQTISFFVSISLLTAQKKAKS